MAFHCNIACNLGYLKILSEVIERGLRYKFPWIIADQSISPFYVVLSYENDPLQRTRARDKNRIK